MIECAQYRRSMLADPHCDDAELQAHLTSCHDCAGYTERLLSFESRLEQALRVDFAAKDAPVRGPAATVTSIHARRRAPGSLPRRWLAAAASVLLAVVIAGGLWLAAPGPSLAADVVDHMAEEPQAWARTDVPVPPGRLEKVLQESHVRLKGQAGMVSYANACRFRGHLVPHLVVQTDAGPVTVMVLTHESTKTAVRFDEHGYRGVIVPVPGHGSLAVLERGSASIAGTKTVDAVAARVLGAIDWQT